jgi:hypothetical protein
LLIVESLKGDRSSETAVCEQSKLSTDRWPYEATGFLR